jgi:thiamine-monophosphate kinase
MSTVLREHQLIHHIAGLSPETAHAIRDDAYWDPVTGMVVSKDVFVEGRHFRLDYPHAEVSWQQVGWRCLAAALSDLAATGLVSGQVAILVGLVMPRSLADEAVLALYEGFNALMATLRPQCPALRLAVVGGDTVGTDTQDLTLSLTVIGHLGRGMQPLTRRAAQPGDRVWLAGDHGLAGLGWQALSGRLATSLLPQPWVRSAVQHHLHPVPQFQAASWLRQQVEAEDVATRVALMDTSDGLADAALQVGEQSGVRLHLAFAPTCPGVLQAAGLDLKPLLDALLYGGEDFGLLATVPPDFPPPPDGLWREVGRVVAATATPQDEVPTGLLLADGSFMAFNKGQCYQHF